MSSFELHRAYKKIPGSNLFLYFPSLIQTPSLNKSLFKAHKQRHFLRLPIVALGESPRTSSNHGGLRKRAAIKAQRLTSSPRPSSSSRPVVRYVCCLAFDMRACSSRVRTPWTKI